MAADPLTPIVQLPGVREAVLSSRSAVDTLLSERVLRRRSADVSAESLLRGAWASAVLAGSDATLAQVRAGAARDPTVQGALRVSVELASLANQPAAGHRQALARLHALAAAGLTASPELGRPRGSAEVAHRLDLLAEVLSQTQAPAVVVAAVVQAEILTLDAFAPSSGIVARGAARLVLVQRGLDPRSLAPFEIGHLQLREEMDAALRDYAAGEPIAVARWVIHCCRAVELGARESMAVCEAMRRG